MSWYDTTWSMSKIKTLEKCPLQFYLNYIVKHEPEMGNDTLARDLGSHIHYILELMMSGRTIQEAYQESLPEYLPMIGQENLHYIDKMMPHVYKFNRMMHEVELTTPLDHVTAEMDLAVDRNFNPVPFRSKDAYFRGMVDYTWRTESNRSRVIDYKKGGKGWLTKYHAPQLSSYLLLDYYCNGKFDEGESFIYYVEAGELSPGPVISGEFIETHTRQWLVDKINAAIERVVDDGEFVFSRSNMCKYCDWQQACSQAPRGTSGALQELQKESRIIAKG